MTYTIASKHHTTCCFTYISYPLLLQLIDWLETSLANSSPFKDLRSRKIFEKQKHSGQEITAPTQTTATDHVFYCMD